MLDRSIGATVTPDPSDAYWDAMALRIAARLDHTTDRVIQIVPAIPTWRRLVGRVWAPTMALALVALVASQKTTTGPSLDSIGLAQVPEKIAKLNTVRDFAFRESDPVPNSQSTARSESNYRLGTVPEKRDLPQSPASAVHAKPAGEADRGYAAAPTQTPPTMAAAEPTIASRERSDQNSTDDVWPERQVIIMGQVDSNSPNAPLADDRRMAGQDPFGAYERQMADAEQGVESVSTFASPGRLLDGPTTSQSRGSERLTPAEQMRRFDEMAELYELIEKLETIPESSRAMSQWTQWSTAWYRLGMLSQQPSVLDSALTAVGYFQTVVPMDSASHAEWLVRKSHLSTRRENLNY